MIGWLIAPAFAIGLDEVRLRAAEQAIEVERARAQAQVADAFAWGVTAGALPSVVAFADWSTGAGTTSFGFPRPVRTQWGFGLQASWQAIDPALWAAAASARRSARGQEALYTWSTVVATSRATSAYAAVQAEQDVVEALRAAYDDAVRQEAAATSYVDAGLRPPADAAQARADRESAYAAMVGAEGEVVALCAALQSLVRLDVTGTCDLEPVAWADPVGGSTDHPAIVAATEALAAARAARAASGLEFAPTVGATGTAAEYLVDGEAGFGWNAGVGVDLPLVTGGSRLAGRAESKARVDEAEAALDAQRKDVEALRLGGRARLEAARARLVALEASLASADEALRLVEERYEAGLEGIDTWLQARRTRDLAAVSVARGRGAVGAAVADLEAALGNR